MKVRIWPVIHYLDRASAFENAAIAAAAGAYGVMLISMEGIDRPLPAIAAEIGQQFPALRVGINLLTRTLAEAVTLSRSHGLDATWADDAGIHSDGISAAARDVACQLDGSHQLFAGVAFKHQRHDPDPPAAAALALQHGLLPTTSGLATGIATDRHKLIEIRQRIGPEARLAVASGVTPGNVVDHIGLVTDILVATGVSETFYRFSETRLRDLVMNCGDRLDRGSGKHVQAA